MNEELAFIVNNNFALHTSQADVLHVLAREINRLILHDINKLISILYRADVNEQKLNNILSRHKNEDAGMLIAVLFIERQMQKIKSRQENHRDNNNFNEEEKW